jgi:hypothetical protein
MSHAMNALRSARRLLPAAVVSISLFAAVCPARAQMTIEEFQEFALAVTQGDKGSGDALSLFMGGLWNAIVASNAANAALGSPQRLCLPQRAMPAELAIALQDELSRNATHWRDKRKQNIGVLAIAAIKLKWPCR